MATIFAEIQFLSPLQTIVIDLPAGSDLGTSKSYKMHVRFIIRPVPIRGISINFKVNIENSGLFAFDDGSNSMTCPFNRVKDGDVRITDSFKITNNVPLTGMQLVLSTESNDVTEPSNIDFDSETYDVITSEKNHVAAHLF